MNKGSIVERLCSDLIAKSRDINGLLYFLLYCCRASPLLQLGFLVFLLFSRDRETQNGDVKRRCGLSTTICCISETVQDTAIVTINVE